MSSVKIPKWIGPALCPVVLVLLIAIVCFYYCYWKPRKEKNKKKKQAEEKQLKKQVISSSLVRNSSRIMKGKVVLHVDEEMSDGCGYYDCGSYTTYEPYWYDYCLLPSSGLKSCVRYEGRPNVVYCPKTKSRDTTAHDCHDQSSRCNHFITDKPARKYRVQCPKGECIKCPDLPIITEGNSTLSLCDEKEEEEEMSTGLLCVYDEIENDDKEKEEVKSIKSHSSVQDYEDSGFEDH